MECPQRSAETCDSTYHKRHPLSSRNLIVAEYPDRPTWVSGARLLTRMYNHDIQKLIEDIWGHWVKANTMGHPLPELMKIQTLVNKAGPNGEAPKCYNCFDTGHIAKKCPKPCHQCPTPNNQNDSVPA
ncbi:uncharacterized protein UHOD_11211 [Ustilago sp. UG-2017b]|nr:uncharacterized protein UHOD_11211 [Ustilago sp. UG-2017b]